MDREIEDDRQGRLYRVKEQAEADATNTVTTCSYNVGKRLKQVQQATSAGTRSLSYPQCAFAGCAPVSRTVSPGYTSGFLTSVPGWAGSITYHANGMLNQVSHANGIVDTQANDPDMMRRPASISSARSGVTLWSSGTYKYDGSGNVVKTGNGYFLYDRVSRLTEGRIYDGPIGGGTQKWQSYTYDPFGNIQSIGGTSGRSTPTSSSSNRLTGGTYDSAGNLTNWNTNVYEYDRFNQMTRMVSGAEDWRYVYTPGDERFWSYRVGGGGSLWALRDLDGRLLREYEAHTSWGTFKDYVYRGTQLLASAHSSEGIRHFHLDHLGTPRLVTAGGTGGDFYTLTPCRVLDTRNQTAPLAAGETRTVPMVGSCGIPGNAAAVAVNITVVNATTNGEMTAYPANESRPTASAISYKVGLALANNGILKLGHGALAFFNNQSSGSAHLIVDVTGYFPADAGAVVAYHAYYPFGEEATAFNQDAEQMKFTGHERDLASLAGAGDDLDYMHARHCSPITARFLSVDPVGGNLRVPQSWNLYSYTLGNPLQYIDPTGMAPVDGCSGDSCFGSISVSPGSWDSAGFENFLWAAGNFGAGFVDATASNLAFGRGRHEFSNSDFQAGQAAGDFVSIFWGLYEVAGGIGGFVTGTLFDLAPGGVLVGVPVQVASAATIIHGGTTSALGYAHLMEANRKGGGKTGRKINAKREEKLQREIEELKAARANAKTKAEKDSITQKIEHKRRQLRPSETHWRR